MAKGLYGFFPGRERTRGGGKGVIVQLLLETPRGEWREMPIPMDRRTEIYIRYDSTDGPQDNVKQYIRTNFPLTEQIHWLIFQVLSTGRRLRQPFFRNPGADTPPAVLRGYRIRISSVPPKLHILTFRTAIKSPETGDVPGSRIPVAESSLHGCRVNLFSGLFCFGRPAEKRLPRCYGSGFGDDYL